MSAKPIAGYIDLTAPNNSGCDILVCMYDGQGPGMAPESNAQRLQM